MEQREVKIGDKVKILPSQYPSLKPYVGTEATIHSLSDYHEYFYFITLHDGSTNVVFSDEVELVDPLLIGSD